MFGLARRDRHHVKFNPGAGYKSDFQCCKPVVNILFCVWKLQVLARRQPSLWWPWWNPCSCLLPQNTPSRRHSLWLRWVMDPRKPHGWVFGWAAVSLQPPSALFSPELKTQKQAGHPDAYWLSLSAVTRSIPFALGNFWLICGFASTPTLQAQTSSRSLPMSSGTSLACSTLASQEP